MEGRKEGRRTTGAPTWEGAVLFVQLRGCLQASGDAVAAQEQAVGGGGACGAGRGGGGAGGGAGARGCQRGAHGWVGDAFGAGRGPAHPIPLKAQSMRTRKAGPAQQAAGMQQAGSTRAARTAAPAVALRCVRLLHRQLFLAVWLDARLSEGGVQLGVAGVDRKALQGWVGV